MFVFNSILCVVQIPHVIKENYNEEKILQLMKLFDPTTFYVIVQKVMFNLAMYFNNVQFLICDEVYPIVRIQYDL